MSSDAYKGEILFPVLSFHVSTHQVKAVQMNNVNLRDSVLSKGGERPSTHFHTSGALNLLIIHGWRHHQSLLFVDVCR
jgi:hypothetical protein